jgi:hypothetical protein
MEVQTTILDYFTSYVNQAEPRRKILTLCTVIQ